MIAIPILVNIAILVAFYLRGRALGRSGVWEALFGLLCVWAPGMLMAPFWVTAFGASAGVGSTVGSVVIAAVAILVPLGCGVAAYLALGSVPGRAIAGFALTGGLLACNLLLFNRILAGEPLFRLDLTEDREYSLTSVTKDLISELDEELYLYGYFSSRTHPKLAPLVPNIRDMMEEYAVLSGGKIEVIFGDPRTDPEIEAEAKQRFGIDPIPFSISDKYDYEIINTYFHVVVAYGDQYVRYGPFDLIEVEPDPGGTDITVRLKNLEYDLTKAIKKVLYGFRSVEALFAEIDTPVRVQAWISPEAELPEDAREVRELLEAVASDLAESSGGKFTYTIHEAPASDDRAAQDALYRETGVRPFSVGFLDPRLFYLSAMIELGDSVRPLYLLEESKSVSEASIREAILAEVRRLVPGFVKTIGIHRPEPAVPPELAMQMGRRPEPPDFEMLRQAIENDHEVEMVSLEERVDPTIDVLFVLAPEDLTEEQVFEMDQYMMRGGKVILALDRYALDMEASRDRLEVKERENPALMRWLEDLGIRPGTTLVQDDRNSPFIVPVVERRGMLELQRLIDVQYPWFVRVTSSGLAEHPTTSRLEQVVFYYPTALEVDEERTGELELTRLVQTSPDAWTDANTNVNPPGGTPDEIRKRWYRVPADTRQATLAVALAGSFESYYADHAPPGEEESAPEEDDAEGTEEDALEEAESEEEEEEEEEPEAPRRSVLRESPPTRLAVLSDAELFSEQFSRIRREPEFEGNLQFALNLIDWALEDSDMIRIRSRGATARPLELDGASPAAVEVANYLVPAGLILLIGIVQLVRRRSRRPAVSA